MYLLFYEQFAMNIQWHLPLLIKVIIVELSEFLRRAWRGSYPKTVQTTVQESAERNLPKQPLVRVLGFVIPGVVNNSKLLKKASDSSLERGVSPITRNHDYARNEIEKIEGQPDLHKIAETIAANTVNISVGLVTDGCGETSRGRDTSSDKKSPGILGGQIDSAGQL